MICINKIQLQLTFAQSEPITSPALSVKDWIVAASVVTITILGIACIIWGLRNYQRPNHRYELVPDMESSPDSQSGNNGTPGTDGRGQYKHVFQIKGTEISLGPRIGKGSYGEVYRARWRGIDVAVKKLPYYLIENKEFMRDFNQEASIMSALRHPNVLQFLGSTMIDNDICILTEYMSRSSLYRLLHDETFDLSYPMIKRFATDTSRGMLYLHKSNPVILHRDLKSHNLLVDDAYKVKISDFGLSKVVEHCNKTMTSCGTAAWAAPEILKNARYTEKADVYSFGVCLWEFWTRKDPYEGMPTFQIIFAVGTEGLRPVVPDACPPDYAQLIRDCWDADPTKRPSFDEILMRLGSLESPEFGSAMHGSSTALRTPQATNKPATSGQSEFYKNNIN